MTLRVLALCLRGLVETRDGYCDVNSAEHISVGAQHRNGDPDDPGVHSSREQARPVAVATIQRSMVDILRGGSG
jgi:hypothetical protein